MAGWFARGSGGVAAWASVSSTSVSPGSGTLRLTGQTPTVYGSTGVIDGGGTIATFVESDYTAVYQLLGYVEADYTVVWQLVTPITPTGTTLRLVGAAPTLTVATNNYIWPSGTTLRLVGQTPTLTVTGDVVEAPTAGVLRFVGQQPYVNVQPHVVAPSVGTLRFVGAAPFVDLGHKVAEPTAGILRLRGLATTYADWTATWQMLDVTVTADWTATWQIGADVAGDFTATWDIAGTVGSMTLLSTQYAAALRATAPHMDLSDEQRSMRLLAA